MQGSNLRDKGRLRKGLHESLQSAHNLVEAILTYKKLNNNDTTRTKAIYVQYAHIITLWPFTGSFNTTFLKAK